MILMTDIVVYPVLELHLTHYGPKGLQSQIVPGCAFHDLWGETDAELAGMGLAMMGNLVRVLGSRMYDNALDAVLLFKRYPGDPGTKCPFPGMPDDRPVPLDLMQFPFEAGMFLNDGKGQYRVDRWQLMARIQQTWVPWLKQQMQVSHA